MAPKHLSMYLIRNFDAVPGEKTVDQGTEVAAVGTKVSDDDCVRVGRDIPPRGPGVDLTWEMNLIKKPSRSDTPIFTTNFIGGLRHCACTVDFLL